MSIKDLSEVKYTSMLEVMKNTVETGFVDYDSHVFDLKPKEITILFGRDGEGILAFVVALPSILEDLDGATEPLFFEDATEHDHVIGDKLLDAVA